MSLFNLQRWLGKQRRSGGSTLCGGRGLGPLREQGRYRFGFGGGAWLEVQGGFKEREVRVLVRIVREAARC